MKNTNCRTNYSYVRIALFSFLITLICLRTVVFLIFLFNANYMNVFVDGIHIHHFSEGFILLAFLSGYMIFFSKHERYHKILSVLYGIALGLSFDEFGEWINLSSNYWQPISYWAIATVTIILSVIAYAPSLNKKYIKPIIFLIILVLFIFIIHRQTAIYLHIK